MMKFSRYGIVVMPVLAALLSLVIPSATPSGALAQGQEHEEPGYRITSLEGDLVTGDIAGVVNAQLRDYLARPVCYTEEDWDEKLGEVVAAVRSQVIGDASWDEKEILAKIISIETGIPTQEILADPYAKKIEEAIGRLSIQWQEVLNATLPRVQSAWLDDLRQQVAQLSIRLENLSGQFDALEQKIDDLKNRKDFIPLALAAIALLLGAVALALTLRKGQKPG